MLFSEYYLISFFLLIIIFYTWGDISVAVHWVVIRRLCVVFPLKVRGKLTLDSLAPVENRNRHVRSNLPLFSERLISSVQTSFRII